MSDPQNASDVVRFQTGPSSRDADDAIRFQSGPGIEHRAPRPEPDLIQVPGPRFSFLKQASLKK
jgi:hypothetical protein